MSVAIARQDLLSYVVLDEPQGPAEPEQLRERTLRDSTRTHFPEAV